MRPGTNEDARAAVGSARIDAVLQRVDAALFAFLDRSRGELAELDPASVLLVDEVDRLVRAGGKRVRPAFCYVGHLAAGGSDGEEIVGAAAALELLHTFALIHDDVMDDSHERRGVPTVHRRLAGVWPEPGLPVDPGQRGRSGAILVGDLAAVLADRLLAESGFESVILDRARRRYDRMRLEMAVGQLLDLLGRGAMDRTRARRVSVLKTGSYTVEGPLHIGAILANGSLEVLAALSRYAEPLGEAYQLRDDLDDDVEDRSRSAPEDGSDRVNRLVDRAKEALDREIVSDEAREALTALAELVAAR